MTTNYDPGIVDARMRVRPGASATGFMTWQDELGLDQWRTGRTCSARRSCRCCIAHGVHNQPDSVVLADHVSTGGRMPGSCRRCWPG